MIILEIFLLSILVSFFFAWFFSTIRRKSTPMSIIFFDFFYFSFLFHSLAQIYKHSSFSIFFFFLSRFIAKSHTSTTSRFYFIFLFCRRRHSNFTTPYFIPPTTHSDIILSVQCGFKNCFSTLKMSPTNSPTFYLPHSLCWTIFISGPTSRRLGWVGEIWCGILLTSRWWWWWLRYILNTTLLLTWELYTHTQSFCMYIMEKKTAMHIYIDKNNISI